MKKELSYKDLKQGWVHPASHIRFKGVWDMQDLYEFMINWCRERKYKFHEKTYKHKHPSPYGVERQYIWHAEKAVTDWYNFELDMYMHTYDAHDVQVKLIDGGIKTYTRGRIWIELTGTLQKLPDERWLEKSFNANLRAFLNNYVLRRKWTRDLWDVFMYREIQKLVWLIRRRLKMEYDEYEQKYWNGVHT